MTSSERIFAKVLLMWWQCSRYVTGLTTQPYLEKNWIMSTEFRDRLLVDSEPFVWLKIRQFRSASRLVCCLSFPDLALKSQRSDSRLVTGTLAMLAEYFEVLLIPIGQSHVKAYPVVVELLLLLRPLQAVIKLKNLNICPTLSFFSDPRPGLVNLQSPLYLFYCHF